MEATPVKSEREIRIARRNMKALAVLYYLGAFVYTLGGVAAITQGVPEESGLPGAIGYFFIAAGLINVIIGYGLWNLRMWAWTGAVVFTCIGLLGFPIGTIISALILWVLFKSKFVFQQGPDAVASF